MRCTAAAKRTGEQCARHAIAGAKTCRVHGSATKAAREAAARNVAEQKARAAAAAEAAKTGKVVRPGQDPLTALEDALADVVAIKERLGSIVDRLNDESLRYEGRAGEQLRGEIQAYMASIRDVVRTAEVLVKLGIAERRQALDEAMAMTLVSVIKNVLNRLELTPDQRKLSVAVVPEELRAVSGPSQDEHARTPLPTEAAFQSISQSSNRS
jgi:hypothetical protein